MLACWSGSLACCSPWSCKESDMTERLNWTGVDSEWFPSPGDLPDPGIKPGSPTWQAGSLPSEAPGITPSNTFSQFSRSVVSDSLWPHELQHARPPCLSQTPRVYSNSCPLSRWCHPAISSSVVPFSSCPQSLQASGSFPMSQLFAWGGQSIGVSASTSVLLMT